MRALPILMRPWGHRPRASSHYIAPTRSATLDDLRKYLASSSSIPSEVKIAGWVSKIRRLKEQDFVILRDGFGKVQVVMAHHQSLLERHTGKLHEEDVVEVVGEVRGASCDGGLEVVAKEVRVINRAKQPLPVNLHLNAVPGREDANISTQARDASLKYRYLELRKPSLQHNLRLRAHVSHAMRRFMYETAGFLEVETPTLFKSTPEGAREFLVPVTVEVPERAAAVQEGRRSDNGELNDDGEVRTARFFALAQSPQQFKQLLMVGGTDRYFQFARCYRDEGGRADRQPEFTQLDLEMSFVEDARQVQRVVEDAFLAGWNAGVAFFESRGVELPLSVRRTHDALQSLPSASSSSSNKEEVSLRFPRMRYKEAMRRFGSDKPDVSFGWELENEGSEFTIPRVRVSKSEFKRLFEVAVGGGGLFYEFTPHGVRVYSKHVDASVRVRLGRVRVKLRHLLLESWARTKSRELEEDDDDLLSATTPLWVEEFPLFEREGSETTKTLVSCHHPFTAPHGEDAALLERLLLRTPRGEGDDSLHESLTKVRGNHFDLVLNGVEIGGGSVRVHSPELQRAIFERALGLSSREVDDKFGQLLEALASGAPPHGGFAFGFDRLVSILAGARSLSSVIAFPKSTVGNDPMSNAPTAVGNAELRRMGIRNL